VKNQQIMSLDEEMKKATEEVVRVMNRSIFYNFLVPGSIVEKSHARMHLEDVTERNGLPTVKQNPFVYVAAIVAEASRLSGYGYIIYQLMQSYS
jgi:hypothetical protein